MEKLLKANVILTLNAEYILLLHSAYHVYPTFVVTYGTAVLLFLSLTRYVAFALEDSK